MRACIKARTHACIDVHVDTHENYLCTQEGALPCLYFFSACLPKESVEAKQLAMGTPCIVSSCMHRLQVRAFSCRCVHLVYIHSVKPGAAWRTQVGYHYGRNVGGSDYK